MVPLDSTTPITLRSTILRFQGFDPRTDPRPRESSGRYREANSAIGFLDLQNPPGSTFRKFYGQVVFFYPNVPLTSTNKSTDKQTHRQTFFPLDPRYSQGNIATFDK